MKFLNKIYEHSHTVDYLYTLYREQQNILDQKDFLFKEDNLEFLYMATDQLKNIQHTAEVMLAFINGEEIECFKFTDVLVRDVLNTETKNGKTNVTYGSERNLGHTYGNYVDCKDPIWMSYNAYENTRRCPIFRIKNKDQ